MIYHTWVSPNCKSSRMNTNTQTKKLSFHCKVHQKKNQLPVLYLMKPLHFVPANKTDCYSLINHFSDKISLRGQFLQQTSETAVSGELPFPVPKFY